MRFKYFFTGLLAITLALTSVLSFGQANQTDVYLTVFLKKTSYKKPLELLPDYFRGLEGVQELSGDRVKLYVFGNVESMKEAKKLMKEAGKAGFTAHRVMGVQDGKEISTDQAESIIAEQAMSAESLANNTGPTKAQIKAKEKADKAKADAEALALKEKEEAEARVAAITAENKARAEAEVAENTAALEASDATDDADKAAMQAIEAEDKARAEAAALEAEDRARAEALDAEDQARAAAAAAAAAVDAEDQARAAAEAMDAEDQARADAAAAEATAAAAEPAAQSGQSSELTETRPTITSTPEPTKPTFANQVYIGDDGKYFVQKSLPIYLYFATAPGGEMHELKSKSTAKYASPMYLDAEGHNTFRSPSCVDPTTLKTVYPLQDVIYDIYADGLPPQTRATLSGATKYVYRGDVFYSAGLTVELKANDGMSGLDNIHYALNGNYQNYSSSIKLNSDGTNTLHYFSNDKVGNSEKTHSKTFTIDASTPKSAYSIVGVSYQGNIVGPTTKFKLSSSDNLSGTRGIYYSYDGGAKKTYSKSAVSPNFMKDGSHTLAYYAEDNVKNKEPSQTFSFYLDKKAPVVSTEILGDVYKGQYTYVSARSRLSITATDNKAGVESISYNTDGTGKKTYSSPISFPDKKGLHYIAVRAVDNVENRSGKKTKAIYMDNRTPQTEIDYANPQFFARDTLFICNRTKVKLIPRDAESGVKNSEYNIDGGSFQEYGVFTVKDEGYHTINFRAIDNVNNQEQQKSSNVFVDNTGPVIYSNFSINSIGTKKKKGKDLKVYPNYTRMYIGATDAHVGTKAIFYSLDGGKTFRAYSSPQTLDISEQKTFKNNKFYSVIIRTKDMLNNESETTIEFYVGDRGD
ncbi:MAG: hypothetical protein HRT71_15295 [Flavobacteriales bacterium]|nr:hypothetical protein [Flavobacteriales bacterium]